jgi:phosphoglycerate dehydrogenase-like enzyme
MKKLCYLGISMHPAAREKLEIYADVSEDQGLLPNANAAIVYSPSPDWISGAYDKLKIIACHSMGGEDLEDWARGKNIKVFESTRIWRTVAEHTLALLLSAIRNIPVADRDVKDGRWKETDLKIQHSGYDMYGKTVGIWGLGKIGKHAAKLLQGFGVKVVYNDIVRLPEETERELQVSYLPRESFFPILDYLLVLLPLNEKTRGIMDAAVFSLLKKGAVLINTARAALIDEGAMKRAVDEGIITAAGLDVFWEEGKDQSEWITGNRRIIAVPHLGGSTRECDMELVDAVLETIR